MSATGLARVIVTARLIRQLCWNGEKGFFFEYDYQQGSQLPYWGMSAYWAL
jgi:neutral trehalase